VLNIEVWHSKGCCQLRGSNYVFSDLMSPTRVQNIFSIHFQCLK
jgi:hypothetical protein